LASGMGVAVNSFEAGLMHVLMSVLSPVVVGVRVLVRDVVVLVCRVPVGVGLVAMVVLVRVRCVMGVLLGHGFPFDQRNMLSAMVIYSTGFVFERSLIRLDSSRPSARHRRGDDWEPRVRRARR